MQTSIFRMEMVGDTLVLAPGENVSNLTGLDVASEVENVLGEIQRMQATRVVVDLGDAQYFGSYMLELMHRIWRQVRAHGGKMAVCNASPFGREVLQVTRLDTIWPVVSAREEALRAMLE